MGKTIQVSGFPCLVSAEEVKKFFEQHTGRGTVDALDVKKCKTGSGAYAKVQFTTEKSVEYIISLGNQRLTFHRSSLKTRKDDIDIIRKPRTYLHSMEHIILHFGCQISREKFLTLWKRTNVSVKFGLNLRKMYFYLSYSFVEYKLVLSYENIWQIELRCPHGQTAKFLLLQLLGAPRIFEKVEGSIHSYFKETPDDQWIRTTDFSPSLSIGESSAICMELPYSDQLPDFHENFVYYKESDSQFILESGFAFSQNVNLVPVVGPPLGLHVPFDILFKICSLVQHGCLPGPALDANFFRLVDPQRNDIACIERALQKLYRLKDCCYEPAKWLSEQYKEYLTCRQRSRPPAIILDPGLVYVRRVQITPSKVYFCGPEVNMSNRVLRNYHEDIDNFLRVSFIDEELNKLYSTDISPRIASGHEERRTTIYKRIVSILKNGIIIGDKRFEFLAYSNSQLRENSLWMFASRPGLTAADIRMWMGDFHRIRNVAKYAARLGQSFSSSIETLSVERHEIEIIPDIKVVSGGVEYVFSDGIGKISADFAQKVALKCNLKSSTPSAFQIRYGGYKGVVAVDPASSMKLSLRKSMSKYESEDTKLDVLKWSKYQPYFLNRQVITLLSTLGVEDHVFERKQREAVAQLDTILTDPLRAEEALELMSSGENTNILKEMLRCGYRPDTEPFLSMMLQTFRASKLLDLQTKTRIFIPKGRLLIGCLDETRTLDYGQVFVQCSSPRPRAFYDDVLFKESCSDKNIIIEGNIVVAKTPCLHPGDVRVLTAVNVPALRHMVDCIVFPQKGKRPHTDECSGSDLDGDDYFVSWDPDLIPPRQTPPMDYTPAPTKVLDHDVTIEEVQEYFANYIVNDSLGIISNAHIVFADIEPLKAMSDTCIELANLSSIAVDFPKTGVPAELPSRLRPKEYPDFMEKSDKPMYVSERALGKLFREVKKIPSWRSSITFTKEVAAESYDPDMEVDGFEDHVDDAFNCKSQYDYKLGNLMDYYGIKTEGEMLSGRIMKMLRSFDRGNDGEMVCFAVRSLRKQARTWFNKSDDGADNPTAKASAWYHVTYHPRYWGRYNKGLNRDHFLSFPWCIYDKLIQIKRDKVSIKRSLHLSSHSIMY